MSLVSLILALVVVGIVMYFINVYIPMESRIKQLLNIAVVAFLVIWLLQMLGLLDYLRGIRIGKD